MSESRLSVDREPAEPAVFVVELAVLLFGPPLVSGLALAALSGTENVVPGLALGAIVGIGAAKLRNELRGMRLAA